MRLGGEKERLILDARRKVQRESPPGSGHAQADFARVRRRIVPPTTTTTASPPTAIKTNGRVPGDFEEATAEVGVFARVELVVDGLVRTAAELVSVVVGVVVELAMDIVELDRVVVELESVDVGSLLPRAIPNSMKYLADRSVMMMSSPKTPKLTTVPLLNWCVYEAMRFLESFTKTDTIEVPLMFVTEFSSCETYVLKTVPPNSLASFLPIGVPVFTTDPLYL
jgi:hypothetical protein